MGITCWCGSNYSLSECHEAFEKNWKLPVVKNLKINWSEDADENSKNNILNYLSKRLNYSVVDKGKYFDISYDSNYISFFKQSLFANKQMYKQGGLFIPSDYKNWAGEPKLPNNFIHDNIKKAESISDIKDINNFVDFKQAASYAIFASKKGDLINNSKRILNKFFSFFPDGSVDFINVNEKLLVTPIIIRNLVKQQVFGIKVSKELLESKWDNKLPMVNCYFDILFNLFGFGFYGFTIPWLDRVMLFTFGARIDFPRVDYAAAYARGTDYNFGSFYSKAFGMSFSDLRRFTGWYINKINILLNYLYNLGTFAYSEEITPSTHYKQVLTFQQILVLVLKILGSTDRLIKKQLSIIFLDIMAHVSGKGGVSEILADKFMEKIINTLDYLPPPLNNEYKKHAQTVYEDIKNQIYDGLVPQYKFQDGIHLDNNVYTKGNYSAKYINALRNTIHGYANSSEYEKIIFTNNDEIPDALSEFIPIIFLSMLIKPSLYFHSKRFKDAFK